MTPPLVSLSKGVLAPFVNSKLGLSPDTISFSIIF